jgi:thiamine biosynthesis lipoprotein
MESLLRRVEDHWVGSFQAMASSCEVLVEVEDEARARKVLDLVAGEARRIEAKYSRYLPDSVIQRINEGGGAAVPVDEETARLIEFGTQLYGLSDGKFDITSGVLRRVWTFDGSDRIPTPARVAHALEYVGWGKVDWNGRSIRLRPGMEIDFGGIGKEYAVDRAGQLADAECGAPCLVNFGGDAVATKGRRGLEPWRVGVEDASREGRATHLINLTRGGLATSGDARRFLLRDGVRYTHILDPATGWPIPDAPRSITVAAGTCVEAGMLSTLAMLHGAEARVFLEGQGVRYWIDE